jgi:hypothetical protein
MANIPSVVTSVIDNSFLEQILSSGRTVLLPILSKYGSEGITSISTPREFEFKYGPENIKKYGLGGTYVKGALQYTSSVLVKRLLPAGATYANHLVISSAGSLERDTLSNLVDVNTVQSVSDIVAALTAKHRGRGYNDLYVQFSSAPEYERYYSDPETGETDYKFTFVNAQVIETQPNGSIKSLGDSVTFSLIDSDPITQLPIKDMFSGVDMYVNYAMDDNEFIKFEVIDSEGFGSELTIGAVESSASKVVDPVFAAGTRLFKLYDSTVRFYKNKEDSDVVPTYFVESDVDEFRPIIVVENAGVRSLAFGPISTPGADDVILPSTGYFVVNGQTSFKTVTPDLGNNTFVYGTYANPRSKIYEYLLNTKVQLGGGSSGSYEVNSNELFSVNAMKSQFISFLSTNEELREILYPRYDFDYVVDWTEDSDCQAAVFNFCNYLEKTLGIISAPFAKNAVSDLKFREEVLGGSSMHSALYSGQSHGKQYNPASGAKITLPNSYFAMLSHLLIDTSYSITEPVANIVKGSVLASPIALSYVASSENIESLRMKQINSIISEPDGTYYIDQLTMYKKSSKLSRINNVKTLHRIRKDLPKLLKDLLQNKAIGPVTADAESRTKNYMDRWIVKGALNKDGILNSVDVKTNYNIANLTLTIQITIDFVGTIEKISIPIIVK